MSGKPSESTALSFEQIFTEELSRVIQEHPINESNLNQLNFKEIIKKKDPKELWSLLFRLSKSNDDDLSKNLVLLYDALKEGNPDFKFSDKINKLYEKIKNDGKNKQDTDLSEDKKELYRLLIKNSYEYYEDVIYDVIYSEAHEASFVGLAFSGGGIRSATFNLGVLQGMAELGILPIFKYLSTVSGGGYIGSWLVAWIRNKGRWIVINNLHPDWSKHNKKEPDEIHHLRDYSNYLTPQKGLLGTDTWLLLTTYLRNSFFNLLILVSVLFSMITFTHLLLIFFYHPAAPLYRYMNIACWSIPFIFIVICISFLSGPKERKRLSFVMIIGVLLLGDGIWKGYYYIESENYWKWVFAVFLLLNFLWVLFTITINEKQIKKIFIKTIMFLIAGGVTGGLLFFLSNWIWMQKRVITGDFREDEFIDLSKVEALCTTLRNDGIIDDNDTHFKAHENTIAHFNEMLEITHLYDNFTWKNYRKFPNNEEINYFIEKTEDCRKKSFPIFFGCEEKIKNLNWFLLNEIYPTRFPHYKIRNLYRNAKKIIDVTDSLRVKKPDDKLSKSKEESYIQWLNKLIQYPALYDRICYFNFSYKVNNLAEKTSDSRKKQFSEMDVEERNNVKKLNRLLIEEMFPNDCPKSKSGKLSRLVFACFGMPTVILIFLFAGALWFLLSRDTFTEDERNNLGRFAVSLLGWTALTTALFAVTIFGKEISGIIVIGFQSFATFAWVNAMIVISGLLQRFILGTEGRGAKWGFKLAIALGMCSIIVGAIIISAWLPHVFSLDKTSNWWILLGTFFGVFVFAIVIASGMNINSLSLHTLYKDRLKRAYLGAEDTKIAISEFLSDKCYSGPYPIINATLNLTKGEELAWQQRKAASFVFTPLHYGYTSNHKHTSKENGKDLEKDAYRSWKDVNDGDKPFTLGDAMAISGAAVSPSMGYRSSGALAFIMTVFNVRLGQWFVNPRHKKNFKKYRRPTCPVLCCLSKAWHLVARICFHWPGCSGLYYLLKELFGWSDDRKRYVYLSDGGHFENLGIYELVRRRCRYIVACDVGEDPDMEFGDLANAIEKCRTDFGVTISINVERMKRNKDSGISGSHYAIGTIEYEKVDPEPARNGVLVYIKSSLTGNESLEIKSYKMQNKSFPHQTTLNQMFDESQFEAYRTLGYHVINEVFGRVSQETRDSKTARKIFDELDRIYQILYPS